jgi:cell division protein FtsB
MTTPAPYSNGFEKYFPTVIASVITALLFWIGYTTQNTSLGVAKLQVQIEGIPANTSRLDRLERRVLDIEASMRVSARGQQ